MSIKEITIGIVAARNVPITFSFWPTVSCVKNSPVSGTFIIIDIHVTGFYLPLISCRRKVAFSRPDPNPPPPDDNQIRNFLGGEWKHRALQELLGPEFSCEEEIQWNGITAHPDAIWKPGGIPPPIIEIKTTNSAGVSETISIAYQATKSPIYVSARSFTCI